MLLLCYAVLFCAIAGMSCSAVASQLCLGMCKHTQMCYIHVQEAASRIHKCMITPSSAFTFSARKWSIHLLLLMELV